MTTQHTPTAAAVQYLTDKGVPPKTAAHIDECVRSYEAHVATIAELAAALREIATARAGDDKFDAYDAADRYRNIARAALAKVDV